jgi:hypothetical protein
MVRAAGISSRTSSTRFGATSTFSCVTPVTLPAGRLRLATRPSRTGGEDDRNRAGRRLGRERAGGRGRREHAYPALNEIGEQRRQPVVLPLRPAKLDRDIAALDVAGIAQALAESVDQVAECVGRAAANESDHRHRRLLRARRERPRDRAAEQGDELAPSHRVPSIGQLLLAYHTAGWPGIGRSGRDDRTAAHAVSGRQRH